MHSKEAGAFPAVLGASGLDTARGSLLVLSESEPPVGRYYHYGLKTSSQKQELKTGRYRDIGHELSKFLLIHMKVLAPANPSSQFQASAALDPVFSAG